VFIFQGCGSDASTLFCFGDCRITAPCGDGFATTQGRFFRESGGPTGRDVTAKLKASAASQREGRDTTMAKKAAKGGKKKGGKKR
jgi:hypothetical protein